MTHGDPFFILSSYILASIQILTLNIPVGHKLLQYNLIQIVTMRSSIKQRRQNHSILVREELLQSSFFLSSCFMATICRGFLVTSRRLLKQLHVLVYGIRTDTMLSVIGVQIQHCQHLDLKFCQFFHGAILMQAGGSVAFSSSQVQSFGYSAGTCPGV